MLTEHTHTTDDINYWKLASRLESGRAQVLKQVAHGDTLSNILILLCEKAEDYNPDMMCSVLQLNTEQSTLHPIAAPSLPDEYCKALDGVTIGMGVGSCGTAAFQQKMVVVEDINTHPYWTQYRALAIGVGLHACWSEPIIGSEGRVFGTFAMYYKQPRKPTEEDIRFIETNASLAAIVFENNLAKQQLIDANNLLSQTIDERNSQLMTTNEELSRVLVQKAVENTQSIQKERITTTQKILSGFAHEINTPLGVATTATSFTLQNIEQLMQDISNNKITKQTATHFLNEIFESANLTQSSLVKTSALISQFKKIDISLLDSSKYIFNVAEFFIDLKDNYATQLKGHQFECEVDHDLTCHSKIALWQIISQLIDNSLEHGFTDLQKGKIGIHVAKDSNNSLVINYQDDGCGICDAEKHAIFEPFFSTKRNSGKIGLGLNVIVNTLINSYNGSIRLVDSPVGIRYEIFIPLTVDSEL